MSETGFSVLMRQEDFDAFAVLSGDDNPIHVDPAYAAKTSFEKTVAHGMYLFSHMEKLLRMIAPDRQPVATRLMFPAPARAGDNVTFHGAYDDHQTIAKLVATRDDGEVVCRLECDF